MIQHAVIEGLEADADVLTIHIARCFPSGLRPRVPDHFKDQPDRPEGFSARVRPQKRIWPTR
jgi:hypothetical protein